MRHAPSQSPRERASIVIVTTDKLVRPEAEVSLASDCDLYLLETWDELIGLVKKHPPDAVLLDIDIVGDRTEQGYWL